MSLVVFDCDGVLVESERLVSRIEAEYFSSHGIPCDAEEVRRLFKGKTVDYVSDALAKRTGVPLSAGFIYEWATAVALGLEQELRAVPGVEQLIEHLREAGVRICVASQSPLARVRLSLRVTGLDRYFEGNIFTASMVEHPKPAPDIFLLAAERMSVSPEHVTVIEDSPSGVLAARSAGMRVYGYAADEDAGALERAGAAVFHSMDDLRLDGRLVENPV